MRGLSSVGEASSSITTLTDSSRRSVSGLAATLPRRRSPQSVSATTLCFRFFTALLATLALSLTPTSRAALAQITGAPTLTPQQQADLAELHAYNFTIENLTRLLQTGAQIDAEARTNPEVKKADDEMSNLGHKSLAELTANAASSPRLVAIAASHGFSPHQLCVAEMAYFQTAMIVTALRSGAPREEMLAIPGVNKDNIDFFDKHATEIDDLQHKYTPDSSLSN